MTDAIETRYRVPFDGSFELAKAPTDPGKNGVSKKAARSALKESIEELDELQHLLYAHDHHSLLLIFQAMDAAGKDGTIRAVMSGVNPTGCQVFSFKQPSNEELQHDFLWRTTRCLPERGRIGVFNRSYYEEVLVVRVHPEYLDAQHIPDRPDLDVLWKQRFRSIRQHEAHLARSGTVIRKFWLNVSKEEQRRRFQARIDEPEKNWKFAEGDVRERAFWDDYMHAYEEALNATSRPWAPWYAIPADDKSHMRLSVARIVVDSLQELALEFPEIGDRERAALSGMRGLLEAEDS